MQNKKQSPPNQTRKSTKGSNKVHFLKRDWITVHEAFSNKGPILDYQFNVRLYSVGTYITTFRFTSEKDSTAANSPHARGDSLFCTYISQIYLNSDQSYHDDE